ncbi:carboxylate-amine ligase [Actinomadura alba]|uniref:Putative glutamate--cysteine ligase 2 n=1 Tax=Actinomadura alba TaxID=406431 RepID=A0ABR7LYQ6_9ACTN|nr:glutamate--cysteine ligase [Actinomadura alba]MBC6469886.1 glutamate--cysteine ligase [Actinomadura alba]
MQIVTNVGGPHTGTGTAPQPERSSGNGLTFGVEEEFLLVDVVSRRTVPRAADVLARLAAPGHGMTGISFHAELLGTQVEATTGICTDTATLRRELRDARMRLAAAAGAEELRIVASGTPVLPGPPPPVTANLRFIRIAEMYAGVTADYQACGCHVHVGVDDRETSVAVVNHLRPWLPTLLALSVNSPFDHGVDSGYGSWRAIDQSRFPSSGVPPWFPSAAAYDAQMARLIDCGVLVDSCMTVWLARPSSRLPTVEVRAADAAATVDEAVLQAALVRGLVRTALSELAAGREAPPVDGPICAAAMWSAARHGLGGPGVHPLLERPLPATRLLAELLRRVRPALEDTGDLAEVRRLLAGMAIRGSGAARQRRAAAGGVRAVVDMLVEQTVCGEGGARDP